MPNVKVSLEQAIAGHRAYRELEFREPKWDDYTQIGDPYVWAPSPESPDMVRPMPLPERVKAYGERLLVEGDKPGDISLLSQLSLRDSKAVEAAICGFFLRVDPRVSAGSTPSPKTSSSNLNGDPASSDPSPSAN